MAEQVKSPKVEDFPDLVIAEVRISSNSAQIPSKFRLKHNPPTFQQKVEYKPWWDDAVAINRFLYMRSLEPCLINDQWSENSEKFGKLRKNRQKSKKNLVNANFFEDFGPLSVATHLKSLAETNPKLIASLIKKVTSQHVIKSFFLFRFVCPF